jgi:hypothetical protein
MSISLHQFLTIFVWFGISALVFFLALIARFYERLSGQRTYYRFFSVPVMALALATLRFASLDVGAGDAVGDLLLFGSGTVLAALCLRIYRLMTSGEV